MTKTDSREHEKERRSKEKEKMYNWSGGLQCGVE
jgi:hypothetical protein